MSARMASIAKTSWPPASTGRGRSPSTRAAGWPGSRMRSMAITWSRFFPSASRTSTSRSSAGAACRICFPARRTSICRRRYEKIGARLGVRTLLLEGGGRINGGMLEAGLIDEVSLLVAPVADGHIGAPSLFDADGELGRTRRLVLDQVERRAGDMLWLRYRLE